MSAADKWTEQLAAWAIPQRILDAAPVSPWGHDPAMFARRADADRSVDTPSRQAAREALPEGGSVLDVGCGAGAASSPLAERAGDITGVDPSQGMLDEFTQRMRAAAVAHRTMRGTWAEAEGELPVVDVVVCHHVAYNVPELGDFVAGLTRHARCTVVLELTAQHPLSWLNDLWLRFHGLTRPRRPTADDAEAVIREAVTVPRRADWGADSLGPRTAFANRAEMVGWVRRRLCLPADRDGEISVALDGRLVEHANGAVGFPSRPIVSLWWDGAAQL